jgi:hypothetical protein
LFFYYQDSAGDGNAHDAPSVYPDRSPLDGAENTNCDTIFVSRS